MEIPFSISLIGMINLENNTVTIVVNRSETSVNIPAGFQGKTARKSDEPKMGLADIVLESALELTNRQNCPEFSAAELFMIANHKHPWINKRSFLSRVLGSAPNHGSFKHFKSQRHYLRFIGDGRYMLEPINVIEADPHYRADIIDQSLWGASREQ